MITNVSPCIAITTHYDRLLFMGCGREKYKLQNDACSQSKLYANSRWKFQMLKSRLQFIGFCVIYTLAVSSFFVFLVLQSPWVVVFLAVLALISIFWPRCTNCGLRLASGKKFGGTPFPIDSFNYGKRYFPGPCARCGQDHWYPYPEPNEDWKNK